MHILTIAKPGRFKWSDVENQDRYSKLLFLQKLGENWWRCLSYASCQTELRHGYLSADRPFGRYKNELQTETLIAVKYIAFVGLLIGGRTAKKYKSVAGLLTIKWKLANAGLLPF